jgi:DNA-binding transcriptional regulator YhcF (GntR family)
MAHSPLDLELERSSDVPLGTQLAWKLRAAIAGGAMRPGDRLPPVRELAAAAAVNVNTAVGLSWPTRRAAAPRSPS